MISATVSSAFGMTVSMDKLGTQDFPLFSLDYSKANFANGHRNDPTRQLKANLRRMGLGCHADNYIPDLLKSLPGQGEFFKNLQEQVNRKFLVWINVSKRGKDYKGRRVYLAKGPECNEDPFDKTNFEPVKDDQGNFYGFQFTVPHMVDPVDLWSDGLTGEAKVLAITMELLPTESASPPVESASPPLSPFASDKTPEHEEKRQPTPATEHNVTSDSSRPPVRSVEPSRDYPAPMADDTVPIHDPVFAHPPALPQPQTFTSDPDTGMLQLKSPITCPPAIMSDRADNSFFCDDMSCRPRGQKDLSSQLQTKLTNEMRKNTTKAAQREILRETKNRQCRNPKQSHRSERSFGRGRRY